PVCHPEYRARKSVGRGGGHHPVSPADVPAVADAGGLARTGALATQPYFWQLTHTGDPMYAAPEQLQAEVFARIPEHYLVRGRASDWARTQLHGAPAPVFLEGPSFDRQGNLWVVDIPWGRIFRIDPQ